MISALPYELEMLFLMTKHSLDATVCPNTLNNYGASKTPFGTFVFDEENWFSYFLRDAQNHAGRNTYKYFAGLNRYSRQAVAECRHSSESSSTNERFERWKNGTLATSTKEKHRNKIYGNG